MISLLCAGLVALAACTKEKTMEPAQQPAAQKTTLASNHKEKPKGPKGWSVRTMHISGPNAGWCDNRAFNCVAVPEMTIIINARSVKDKLDEVAGENSATAVAQAFSNPDWQEFTDIYIPEECLEKLQSGLYYLKKMNDDGKRASYIAGTTMPLTLESMEFAIQFDAY